MLDGEDFLLEDCDLLKHLGQSYAQGGGDLGVGIAQCKSELGFGGIHTERDSEAELAQDATKSIHATLPGTHPLAAQPVQGLDLLSLDGLDRHLSNLGAARSFNERARIGFVRLITPDIGLHVMGRQQAHGVPEGGNSTRPEVSTATGFHDDLAGSKMHEEAQKLRASEPLALRDPPIRTRNGELEDIFCQINSNDRSIHIGLLLVRLSLKHHTCSAWRIDAVLPFQEESISTVRAIAGAVAAKQTVAAGGLGSIPVVPHVAAAENA